MGNNEGIGVVAFIIICIMAWNLWSQHNDIIQLRDTLLTANSNIETANSNIEEANTTIEDLNSQIEDAKGNAWADYDTMGQSLDGLTTGDTVGKVFTVVDPTQQK